MAEISITELMTGRTDLVRKLYEDSRDQILLQIAAMPPNPSRLILERKLRDIENIMALATDQASIWATGNIPDAYKSSVVRTRVQMVESGVPVATLGISDSSIDFDEEIAKRIGFGGVHSATAEVLTNRLIAHYEEIDNVVLTTTRRQFRRANLEAITQKALGSGVADESLRDALLRQYTENSLTGFVDSAGRTWKMESYAEMVSRTTTREAVTTAAAVETLERGFDLVAVIGESVFDGSPCIPFEGQELSLTGKTEGKTTLEDAMAEGLFHPNCIHDTIPVISSQSRLDEPPTPEEVRKAIPVMR